MASDVITEITDGNFADEVEQGEGLYMIDFWAEWCGPCRMIAPTVDDLANEYQEKGLKVGKLNVDEQRALASQFPIRGIPTLFVFENGQVIDHQVGWGGEQRLTALFEQLSGEVRVRF